MGAGQDASADNDGAAAAAADATTTVETLPGHCVVLGNLSDAFAAQLKRWQPDDTGGGGDTRKSRRLELIVEDEAKLTAARELLR